MSPHIVSPQIREICSDGITFSSQVQSSSHWFSLLGSNKHFAGNPLKHYKKRKEKSNHDPPVQDIHFLSKP